jgi:hypothetical protein
VADRTGYEFDYYPFVSLFEHLEGRRLMMPLLAAWFGVAFDQLEHGYAIVGDDGRPLTATEQAAMAWEGSKKVAHLVIPGRGRTNLRDLYLRIQSNPAFQYEAYQAAMNVWR